MRIMTWNMQGAGRGRDHSYKWTRLAGFLASDGGTDVDAVAIQESGLLPRRLPGAHEVLAPHRGNGWDLECFIWHPTPPASASASASTSVSAAAVGDDNTALDDDAASDDESDATSSEGSGGDAPIPRGSYHVVFIRFHYGTQPESRTNLAIVSRQRPLGITNTVANWRSLIGIKVSDGHRNIWLHCMHAKVFGGDAMELVIQAMDAHSRDSHLLVGDFNRPPDARDLLDTTMVNAACGRPMRLIHPNDYTWTGQDSSGTPIAKILDYGLAVGDTGFVEAFTEDMDCSDHSAVVFQQAPRPRR